MELNFFQCKDLPSQFLNPARAIPAKLFNIKQLRAKVIDIVDITTVKLWIPDLGDLGEDLVGCSLASWVDDPFEPRPRFRHAVCTGRLGPHCQG